MSVMILKSFQLDTYLNYDVYIAYHIGDNMIILL